MPLTPEQHGASPLLQLEMEIMQKRIYFGSTKSSLSVNRHPAATSSSSQSLYGDQQHHQQQQYLAQMGRYLETASDKESIYLFESVSTSSRLLDRLEMGSIYSSNEDDVLNGKILEKLHLPPTATSNTTSRSNSLTRLSRSDSSHSRKQLEVNLRSVSQAHKVLRMSNASIDSLHADLLAASTTLSLPENGHIYEESDEEHGQNATDDEGSDNEFTFNNSSSETLEIDAHPRSADDILYLPKTKSRPVFSHGHSESISHIPSSTPQDRPLLRSKSTTNAVRGIPLQAQRRIISENNTNSSPILQHRFMELGVPNGTFTPSSSTTSIPTVASPSPSKNSLASFIGDKSNDKLTPESRTNLALQLRNMGKHREASYQLQIAANNPNNYPRAMFLYAMALKEGHGVKQNDRHCLKWLCRCIIYEIFGDELDKIFERSADDIVKSIIILDSSNSYDPVDSYKYYKLLPSAQFQRIVHLSTNIKLTSPALTSSTVESAIKSTPAQSFNGSFNDISSSPNSLQSDTSFLPNSPIGTVVLGNCFHELGNALLTGNGLMKKDEIHGIKMISRAGSMGHVDSMLQLGDIWCHKSKHHKKDLYLASAWLRLGELFGAKTIGNSWIYKEKYLKEKSSSLH